VISRRTLALAAALALAGTLAFPSAAAPLLDGPSDDVSGGVELLPAADSEYATIGPDGKLALDLTPGETGLNPDSVTVFGDVFYLRYTGDRYAEVWVTADSDEVTFEVAGQPVDSRAEGVRLGTDEAVPVSVRVNTTEGDLDVDDITVHSRVAEPETADAMTVDDKVGPNVRTVAASEGSRQFTVLHASAGEPVALDTSGMSVVETNVTLEELSVTRATDGALSVGVRRVGASSAGPLPASGADALGAVEVTTKSSEREIRRATFRFSVAEDYLDAVDTDAGDLTLYRHSDGEWSEVDATVVGERAGRLFVAAEADGFSTFVLAAERPAIGVQSASVDPATAAADEPVTVTGEVENAGGAAGERTVALTLDGRVVAEQAVALDAGESTTVTFTTTPSPGEYDVAVGGTDAGSLVVEAGSGDGTTAASGSGDESDAAATDGADETPVAEPAGIDLQAVAGVSVMLALVVATLALVRRLPRE
jgi:hypothetical protein